jgi:uncharacterized glyoxalase superfamily protein PhnB
MMIPFIRYDDAPAALDWLTRAFGFEQNMVVPGDEGARSPMRSSRTAAGW